MAEIRYDLRSGNPSAGSEGGSAGWWQPKVDPDDPFRYGWRYREVVGEDGEERLEQVPLTYEDVLDPQVGDQVVQDSLHNQLTRTIYGLLHRHYVGDVARGEGKGGRKDDEEKGDEGVGVFSDLKVYFAVPGLRAPAPDVCLVRGVRDRGRRRKSFDAGTEGSRPHLVIEVVSPDYRRKDYRDNLPVYERAGVEEYLIVDLLGAYLAGPYRLTAYRLDPEKRRYRRIKPTVGGELRLELAGLSVKPDPEGWGLAFTDLATGGRLLTDAEMAERAERRAADLEAELERLRRDRDR